MTVFAGVCSVTSCPFNLGQRGLACDWLRNGRGRCHHPLYREAWALGHELAEARAAEAARILAETTTARTLAAGGAKMQGPAARPSMTSRATAASNPMDAARARQMLLDLGEV